MIKNIYNKQKIINDPIYGFTRIPTNLVYDIIQNPFFQRLRRIKQLGLTNYVYPGANHSRFQHVLGATHLMEQALIVLISKGIQISDLEFESALIAILLHDIGHPPLSHTLEFFLIEDCTHEELSFLIMKELNKLYKGKLNKAIEIFTNKYYRVFFHQLVSGQLDMDRLDYLRRDSFFTGVSEGVVGSDRIIKMLNVIDNQLVVEEKGIYSIEKFLIARRIMYWQVYLHKTVLIAERILINILRRAKELFQRGEDIYLTPALFFFFKNKINKDILYSKSDFADKALKQYVLLDDYDIFAVIKQWQFNKDKVLSILCGNLLNRNLFRIEMQSESFSMEIIKQKREQVYKTLKLDHLSDTKYFVYSDSVKNNAYSEHKNQKINILGKNNSITDIAEASDVSNISVLSKTVEKFYFAYPKNLISEN